MRLKVDTYKYYQFSLTKGGGLEKERITLTMIWQIAALDIITWRLKKIDHHYCNHIYYCILKIIFCSFMYSLVIRFGYKIVVNGPLIQVYRK